MPILLKSSLSFLLASLVITSSFSQEKKKLVKSWIKRESYTLPDNTRVEDTLYTRYSFQRSKIDISFSPGWSDNAFPQEWELSGDQLRIGFTTYTIEELTDSTLIIASPGFRRVVLDDEKWLSQKPENLHVIGVFNNEPLYEANKFITPRYKKDGLRNVIQQSVEGYNVKKATTFIASFIVKKDGTIDNIQIIKGITDGFDAEVTRQLKKTSKDWSPAVYKGQPIQTQILYTIKYLDSIVK